MTNALDDAQQAFLRTFMAKRTMRKRDAEALLNKLTEREDGNIDRYVAAINLSLKPISLEIRRVVSEDDGDTVYGLANDLNDEHSKLATHWSATQVTFFKKIVEGIVDSSDGELSSIAVMNIVTPLSKADKQTMVSDCVRDGLMSDGLRKGYYTLGPRSLLELQSYLLSNHENDILKCQLCKQLVIKGQRCSNEECAVKVHLHCASRRWGQAANPKCDECGSVWAVRDVRQRADGGDNDANVRGKGKAPARDSDAAAGAGDAGAGAANDASTRPKRTRGQQSEEQEEEDAAAKQPTPPSRAKRSRRGNNEDEPSSGAATPLSESPVGGRRTRRRAAPDADGDDDGDSNNNSAASTPQATRRSGRRTK